MNYPIFLRRTVLLLFGLFQFVYLGQSQTTEMMEIAINHLETQREALGLEQADIRNYTVSDAYRSKHNGVTHLYLNQTHQEIPILNALININIMPNGRVLHVGNRFIANAAAHANGSSPAIDPSQAVAKVMEAFDIKGEAPGTAMEQPAPNQYIFDPAGIALEAIKVKLVYQPMEDQSVKLAWQVEFYQLDAQHWWNARVDAHNGNLLAHDDNVIHCSFNAPTGNCSSTDHSHSTNISQGIIEQHESHKNLGPVFANSFASTASSYFAFPFPLFDPDHGNAELIVNPVDLIASPFGWHDTDGMDGAEYTITRGNNVHAYQDIFSLNESQGDEPDGGESLEFNYAIDENNNFPYTQVEGATVNLFYWNNIIHDLWYHYGFDEEAGNFQENNYGNGGEDGDYVRAEALDGSGTNNANFGSGADGSPGRMQMYIWSNQQVVDYTVIYASAPGSVAGAYDMEMADFGGAWPTDTITSEVVIVDDGVGVGSDACEDIVNGAGLMDKIALIDRGSCEFGAKALKAENEGAIAVIICNNVAGDILTMAPGADGDDVTIPALMISQNDCATLRMAIPGLVVKIARPVLPIPLPGLSGIDGDFDNGIVVHEYTHGISNRLTGGPSTGGCLNNDEQAGEGWSDWFALVMSTTSANSADEPRGMGTYASGESVDGEGIRQHRYSTDMNINPHTYGDVPNVAIPHGVGSVWCVMIWDLYWAMIEEHGFSDDIYLGDAGNNMAMQLVVDGMKLQACGPSFVESRDAILAADEVNYGGANRCLIWEVFARRGLGVSASAGGIEAFDKPNDCTPLIVNKSANGNVLPGEEITYTITMNSVLESEIENLVAVDEFPANTSLVEGSLSCSDAVVDGNTLTINPGNISSQNPFVCTYTLKVDDDATFATASFSDGLEQGSGNWTTSNGAGSDDWALDGNSFEGDFAWHASNPASASDQYLTMPLSISGSSPALVFHHSYNTQTGFDGGVVELSVNGGDSWFNLQAFFLLNGYQNQLQTGTGNALGGQRAFHGNSNGYIASAINMSPFNGQDIILRFRFATSDDGAADGWRIDNIALIDSYHAVTNNICVNAATINEVCTSSTTFLYGDLDTHTEDISNIVAFNISPNPTNGLTRLEITSHENEAAQLYIRSVDGRLMQSQKLPSTNASYEIDLSAYTPGVYLFEVQQKNGPLVKKVVLQ